MGKAYSFCLSHALGLFPQLLLSAGAYQDDRSSDHQNGTGSAIHPCPVSTGLGQGEAAGIDNGQRHDGIDRFAVGIHRHSVAVHLGGSSQKTVLQMLLWHVLNAEFLVVGFQREIARHAADSLHADNDILPRCRAVGRERRGSRIGGVSGSNHGDRGR